MLRQAPRPPCRKAKGGPAVSPIPPWGLTRRVPAYSAASVAGMTEMKVRPFSPLRNVTLPSTIAKMV